MKITSCLAVENTRTKVLLADRGIASVISQESLGKLRGIAILVKR